MKTIKIQLTNKDRVFYGVMASEKLRTGGTLKEIEIELQRIIENVVSGCWWEFTDRNIFSDLLEHKNNLDYYIFYILIPSIKD